MLSWRLRSCSSAHGGPVINKPSVGQVIKFYPSCITSVTTGWGCPELGPPEPAHQGQRPGQPRCPWWRVLKPRAGACAAQTWTCLDTGHRRGRTHPARTEPAAIYKPKPGEAKWLRPEWLQAPSPAPHGFLFPSPHSSPTSHCPGQLSLDNLPGPHSDPHTPRPRPFSLLVGGGGVPFNSSPPPRTP